MPSAVTLSNLIQSVRRRANIENQTAFIPDAEITEYINYGLSDLSDILVEAAGQPWYRASKTFTTSSNVDTYSWTTIGATDMYLLQSVDIQISAGGETISALPFMEAERNRYKYYPTWTFDTPVFYRMEGSGIKFIPVPNGQHQVVLNYYPVNPFLVSGSDTFDGVNAWEEYAIWRAVSDCKAKLEEDPSYAIGRMAQLRAKIIALAEQRDTGSPERMKETHSELPWHWR